MPSTSAPGAAAANGTAAPPPAPAPVRRAPSAAPVGRVTTNDGVELVYEKFGSSSGPTVVLIHGWGGSRHFYDSNARPIARACTVYTYDQRFHGESGKPSWGFSVARLAADLHDLLAALGLERVTLVGASMGAAVIWAYFELYGAERVDKAVFVDQAPLQNVAPDWRCGSNGCYDTQTLTQLQCRLGADFIGLARDTVALCTTGTLAGEVRDVLVAEMMRASPGALARLMADHTARDWRPLLPRVGVECLNIVGRHSQVFPWWGCEVVGKLVPRCETVFFEGQGHWLYLEEVTRFNGLVAAFAQSGLEGVAAKLSAAAAS
jgi:non-heme chloroperoxidase